MRRLIYLGVAAVCMTAGVVRAAEVVLDDFEADPKSSWEANGGEGSTASIAKVTPAKSGERAAEVVFDVKPGGWGLVQKKFEGAEWLKRGPKAVSFWLKGGGEGAGKVTVELEESYTFKWRKEVPLTGSEWEQVTIQLSEFGSPGKAEMSAPDLVAVKFVCLGGSVRFQLDDLKFEVAEAAPAPAAAAGSAATPLAPANEKRGIIRSLSPNRRYFADDQGKPFIAVGQNRYNLSSGKFIPGSIDDYLRNMAAHGQNTLRVWAESDADPTQWLETKPGEFNEQQAKRIDELFDAAARHNIHIILTPWDTWRIVHSLKTAVYVQSGHMAKVSDFLTDPKIHDLQMRKWKYMIDRWGSRENLLAWELVNEIDVFKASPEAELVWTEKMGSYIRANDPSRHLITISFSQRENDAIWSSPLVDFVSPHFYGDNPVRGVGDIGSMMNWLMHKRLGGYWRFGKPVLFAEVGPGSKTYDPRWAANMIWSSVCAGSAGTAMRWSDQGQWGSASAEEYRHNAALRRFCNFVDWGVFAEKPLYGNRIRSLSKDSRAFGIAADDRALVWLEGLAADERKYSPEFRVSGLSRGVYALYFFDPDLGDVKERQFLRVRSDAIKVRAPGFGQTLACYLEKVASGEAKPAERAAEELAEPSGDSPGDEDGVVRCAKRRESDPAGPKFQWDESTAFAVDRFVPDWHERFDTRVSDGVAPDSDGDLSAQVHAAWDEKNFHVMARVRDDVLVTDRPPEQAYNMDSLELYFSADNGKKRRSYLAGKDLQVVLVLKDSVGSEPQAYLAGKPVGKTSVVFKPDGYTVLASIPFDALGFRPEPGMVIGFDLQLNDCDDPKIGRETGLAWAGGDNSSWCDPSVFGELEFTD